jgi:predicted nucleotidyltransferase
VSLLGERLLAVHAALETADLPHAFGGAIALAYCTGEPRGTRDLDVNIFIPAEESQRALDALPAKVRWDQGDARALSQHGQVRLWWEETPVDLFVNVHRFHDELVARIAAVPFEGQRIPVLDCTDLAVFKALFDRTKDWADIEEMAAAGTLDAGRAVVELRRLGGAGHPAIARLERVSQA